MLTVINANAAVTLFEQRPEKIQALSGIQTHDLCDASAVLSQLSYQSHMRAIVFQTSPILKAFLAIFGIPFSYLQMVPHVHDLQGYIYYARLSLWPCLTFFELKIINILKSSGWGLEKIELP